MVTNSHPSNAVVSIVCWRRGTRVTWWQSLLFPSRDEDFVMEERSSSSSRLRFHRAVGALRPHASARQMWHLAARCLAGPSFEREEQKTTWLILLVGGVHRVPQCRTRPLTFMSQYLSLSFIFTSSPWWVPPSPHALPGGPRSILRRLAEARNRYRNVTFCIPRPCALQYLDGRGISISGS